MGKTTPAEAVHAARWPADSRPYDSTSLSRPAVIYEIVVGVREEESDWWRVISQERFTNPVRVVEGGGHPAADGGAGLAALDPHMKLVVVHDAVRPFVTPEIVRTALPTRPGATAPRSRHPKRRYRKTVGTRADSRHDSPRDASRWRKRPKPSATACCGRHSTRGRRRVPGH